MTSIKYGILNEKNPEYKELEIKKLEILYEGGACIEKNAHLFIHQETARGESGILYNDRIKCVSYRNYMAKIINDYVSDLFSKSFAVMPASDASDKSTAGDNIVDLGDDFYREFARDADLQNHGLSYVLSNVLTEGMVSGRAYLGVDFPKVNEVPTSLLEEEQSGALRAYTYYIPTLSVIDWEEDEFGKYKYVVLRKESIPRKSFTDSRNTKVIQFKVWEKIDGMVKYSTYEITCKPNKEPSVKDECVLIDQGTVSFKEIPVLCVYMPSHLWIGGLIGNLAAEHFRRSSSLVFAMNRNLFSIPVYKQGAELPASGDLSELGQNPNRGSQTSVSMKAKGFAVIGPEDSIDFAEPTGSAYEIIDQQLKELIDAIHGVVNQMGSSVSVHSKTLSNSGLSKMMDNHSKELVLSSYADLVKDFATNLYKLISQGRNENIYWRATGMDDFKIVDPDVVTKQALDMSKIQMLSRTWKKQFMTNLAFATLGDVEPETKITIKNEIDEAIDAMSDDEFNGAEEDEEENGPPSSKKDVNINKKDVKTKDSA